MFYFCAALNVLFEKFSNLLYIILLGAVEEVFFFKIIHSIILFLWRMLYKSIVY